MDEIEQVSFKTSPSPHWRDGADFVLFWQTLRSLFQKNNSLFCYMIVGTNPMCIETATINGVDNPIFQQTSPSFIPRFDVDQTKEMVATLGASMGLQFDHSLYARLYEDFGGHPFLIRQICSHIHKNMPLTRPVRVDRIAYQDFRKIFQAESAGYIEMILVVLKNYYPDEYDMLIFLATGDNEAFSMHASASSVFTNHLLGYGIIEHTRNGYDFRIDAVRDYLVETERHRKVLSSDEERWAEINELRNKLELELRITVRRVLQLQMNKTEAKNAVLTVLGQKAKTEYGGLAYEALFDGKSAELYFNDLTKIIGKHWSNFENVFGKDRSEFERRMNTINKGRDDAHANTVGDEKLANIRMCIKAISDQISDF